MTPKSLCFVIATACMAPTLAAANVGFECGTAGGVAYDVVLLEAQNVAQLDTRNQATSFSDRSYMSLTSAATYFNPNTGFTFQDQGGTGVLSSNLGVRLNCVVSDITGSPETTVPAGNFPGFSFGGNLRAGPGTNTAGLGSTSNGQPLTLVSDTGVSFNGFTWWLVRLQNGQQAYQWGGLLCAPGHNLGGIFNDGC